MADRAIGELVAAAQVTPTDLFVLEQNGEAKRLTGQVLENWLLSFADGHGGIQKIEKVKTDVLADTYRMTLSDTTTINFTVTNGRGITGITGPARNGLNDTYTIAYNDGTAGSFTVTNGRGIDSVAETKIDDLTKRYTINYNDGASTTFDVKDGEKGDTGAASYVHIKYASQEPTADSHSFGDIPDDWIGVYSGTSAAAPTDWQQYKWFEIKGEKGNTGDPAALVGSTVEYQVSDSGTIVPSGVWSSNVPAVAPGSFLWTRITNTFNSGAPVVAYTVARFGIDGQGAVSTVCGVSPDANNDVNLSVDDIEGAATMYASAKGDDDDDLLPLGTNTITKVPLRKFVANSKGAFSLSGEGIQVPKAGVVQICGSVYVKGAAGNTVSVFAYKNGVEAASAKAYSMIAGSPGMTPVIVPVEAGDILTLHARDTAGSDCIPNAKITHLDIVYL